MHVRFPFTQKLLALVLDYHLTCVVLFFGNPTNLSPLKNFTFLVPKLVNFSSKPRVRVFISLFFLFLHCIFYSIFTFNMILILKLVLHVSICREFDPNIHLYCSLIAVLDCNFKLLFLLLLLDLMWILNAGCGVCHSDLHVMKGEIPFSSPCVVGHEITGEVVEHGQHTDSKTIERLKFVFFL